MNKCVGFLSFFSWHCFFYSLNFFTFACARARARCLNRFCNTSLLFCFFCIDALHTSCFVCLFCFRASVLVCVFVYFVILNSPVLLLLLLHYHTVCEFLLKIIRHFLLRMISAVCVYVCECLSNTTTCMPDAARWLLVVVASYREIWKWAALSLSLLVLWDLIYRFSFCLAKMWVCITINGILERACVCVCDFF